MALSDRDRAALIAAKASCSAALATIEAILTCESTERRASDDLVNLELATAMLGSKRKAREFFARAEREGFEVRRVGHAVFMTRAEWDRAVAAMASKRAPKPAPSTHTNSTDESPAAIFASAGLVASHQPNRGGRGKRAA